MFGGNNMCFMDAATWYIMTLLPTNYLNAWRGQHARSSRGPIYIVPSGLGRHKYLKANSLKKNGFCAKQQHLWTWRVICLPPFSGWIYFTNHCSIHKLNLPHMKYTDMARHVPYDMNMTRSSTGDPPHPEDPWLGPACDFLGRAQTDQGRLEFGQTFTNQNRFRSPFKY